MIKFLIRVFVKDYENTSDSAVRKRYSVLGGAVGIICNIFLFVLKLVVGTMMKSIAVISDAFNNFSDIASSAVTVLGAKLSVRREDEEHPFGHGRFEYISGLIVSFLILSVGIELLKASATKIIHPEKVIADARLLVILTVSVVVKIWMFVYNRYLGRKINSKLLEASARDSLNDVLSTLGIIAATAAGNLLPFPIDGYIGALVSAFILYSGFSTAKDTIGALLGTPPSPELVADIKKSVLAGKDILDIHDLVVHDYGPGKAMASLHAEVPVDCKLTAIHETVDEIERDISSRLGIDLVIHIDPIIDDESEYSRTKAYVSRCASEIDGRISIHDFKMNKEDGDINLIFDLAIPAGTDEKELEKIILELTEKIKSENPRYHTAIKVDYTYL